MRTLVRQSLLIPILFLSASLHAQWTNVAPNLVPDAGYQGAMQFKDGIIWAGSSVLWNSLDLGMSWNQIKAFPKAFISDIAFYDKLHGMVATEDQGIFYTSNQGLSWVQVNLSNNNIVKAGYGSSDAILFVLNEDDGLHISTDGGSTWSGRAIPGDLYHSFAVAQDQTIYVDVESYSTNSGSEFASADGGISWNQESGIHNGDCWTMAVDSCDSKRLYLANEEEEEKLPNSNSYLSLDGGATWQTRDTKVKPYLSGSLATTYDAILIGTRDGRGLNRSMDFGITWQSIGGPNLEFDSRNIAVVNDNFILASDSAGNIWRTTNGGGDSVQSTFKNGIFSITPSPRFTLDTLGCDTVVRWIHVQSVGCRAPQDTAFRIIGSDPISFSVGAKIVDSVPITFVPHSTGMQADSLVVFLSDGTFDTVSLGGFVSTYSGTVLSTPNALFTGDTVHCDSMMGTVHLQWLGCRIPPANFFVTGPDSTSFRIVDSTRDSLSILWKSQQPGKITAWLVSKTATGQRDSVSLSGYSTTAPTTFSPVPQNLFSGDTLYVGCDPAVPEQILISDKACLWPNVVSEHVVGPGAKNYTIVKPSDPTIVGSDIIRLSFLPSDTGNDSAVYVLVLNDTTFSIPLAGVGTRKHVLQLFASTQNVKTDTIGGEVEVPVVIDTLARPESVELSIEFPLGDLVYDSTVDENGLKVDIAGDQSYGHTRILVHSDSTGIIKLFVRFKVFSDTDYKPVVTFDSLTVPTELATCAYSYPPSVTDTIQPLEGCAIQMLSRWVHFCEEPLFRVIPNPSPDGNVSLVSSYNVGTVTIEAYDAIGIKRASMTTELNSSAPLVLPFPSGIYFLRIISVAGAASLPVLIRQ